MGERAPVSAEDTLVRYDNPVLVTKRPEKEVCNSYKNILNSSQIFKSYLYHMAKTSIYKMYSYVNNV